MARGKPLWAKLIAREGRKACFNPFDPHKKPNPLCADISPSGPDHQDDYIDPQYQLHLVDGEVRGIDVKGVEIARPEFLTRFAADLRLGQNKLETMSSEQDLSGNSKLVGSRTYAYLRQTFQGYPVIGTGITLREDDGFVSWALGRSIPDLNVDINAPLSERDALEIAQREAGKGARDTKKSKPAQKTDVFQEHGQEIDEFAPSEAERSDDDEKKEPPAGVLVISTKNYSLKASDAALVRRFEFPDHIVEVNAKTGEIWNSTDRVYEDNVWSSGDEYFEGGADPADKHLVNFIADDESGSYRLLTSKQWGSSDVMPPVDKLLDGLVNANGFFPVQIETFDGRFPNTQGAKAKSDDGFYFLDGNADNIYKDADDNVGVSVQRNAQRYVTYLANRFTTKAKKPWLGIDGEGDYRIKSYIEKFPKPDANSDLDRPANVVTLRFDGFGDLKRGIHPFVSGETVGHEITHGLINFLTAKVHRDEISYQGESGALSEAFADMFGLWSTYYFKEMPNVWDVGLDEFSGKAGRSLGTPKVTKNPDTYKGTFFNFSGLQGKKCEKKTNDRCGVHTNSTVVSHVPYLLTFGDHDTNDNDYSYDVKPIGFEKTEQIFFDVLKYSLLTPAATFMDARMATLKVAEDRYGRDSQEYQSTAEAWAAVGVGEGLRKYSPPSGAIGAENWLRKLTWTPLTGEKRWLVQIALDREFQNVVYEEPVDYENQDEGGSVVAWTEVSLAPSTTYYWRVRPLPESSIEKAVVLGPVGDSPVQDSGGGSLLDKIKNVFKKSGSEITPPSSGESASPDGTPPVKEPLWGETQNFTTMDKKVEIVEPANQTVAPWQDVKIRWKTRKGTTSYKLSVSENPNDACGPVTAEVAPPDYQNQKGVVLEAGVVLHAGRTYYADVETTGPSGIAGECAYKTGVPFSTSRPKGEILSPQPNATFLFGGSVPLTWKAVPGASRYRVKLVNVTTGEEKELPVEAGQSGLDLKEMIPETGGPFIVQVAPVGPDSVGNEMGDWSEPRSFVVKEKEKELGVPALNPIPDVACNTSIALSWSSVPDAIQYRLMFYDEGNPNAPSEIDVAGTSYASAVLSMDGRQKCVTVRAVSAKGKLGQESEKQCFHGNTPPAAPVPLTPAHCAGGIGECPLLSPEGIVLSWDSKNCVPAKGFEIYMEKVIFDSFGQFVQGIPVVHEFSYFDFQSPPLPLDANSHYYWWVRAIGADGQASKEQTFHFVTGEKPKPPKDTNQSAGGSGQASNSGQPAAGKTCPPGYVYAEPTLYNCPPGVEPPNTTGCQSTGQPLGPANCYQLGQPDPNTRQCPPPTTEPLIKTEAGGQLMFWCYNPNGVPPQ